MPQYTDPDAYRKSLGWNPELSHNELALMRDAAACLMGAVRHLVSVLPANAHEDPEIVAAARRALVALGRAGANSPNGIGRKEWEACGRINAMAQSATPRSAATVAEAKAEHCEPEMVLPIGKTCGDCRRFAWCRNHFGCKPTSRHCDWNPHRFATAAPATEGIES